MGVAADTNQGMTHALNEGFTKWKTKKSKDLEKFEATMRACDQGTAEGKKAYSKANSQKLELAGDLQFCVSPVIRSHSLQELWDSRMMNCNALVAAPGGWPYIVRPSLQDALLRYSAITLVDGRRRCGKTTLVKHVFNSAKFILVDLMAMRAEANQPAEQ